MPSQKLYQNLEIHSSNDIFTYMNSDNIVQLKLFCILHMYGNFSAEECLFNMYTLPNAL